MAALRLPKGIDHTVFLPAAGLPWVVAPFGHDNLIVSLQNMLIYPEFARGALEIQGSVQARDDDPYPDAEPGKILHELRCGELVSSSSRISPITEPRTRPYLSHRHATPSRGQVCRARRTPRPYALDGNKNKVLTVASNAGHCLWCGIVPRERAKRVVEHLMTPDMWTGWGICTLSADHRAIRTIIRLARCGRTRTAQLRVASDSI
jgi:glycogen debranching enzyme